MSAGFQDPSEVTVSGQGVQAYIGSDGIQAVTPAVTPVGLGTIAQQYASTFDYRRQFTCDSLGYRTFARDLAWIEMWAADTGTTNYFFVDKIKAIEIPITGIRPNYNGRWSKLGEGRQYDLYVRYRHKAGNESQISNALVTGIGNMGVGSTGVLGQSGLAMNPNPSTPPVVASSSIASAGTVPNTGATNTQVLQLSLTPPANNGWIKYVCIWALPTVGAPVAVGMATPPSPSTPPNARVPFNGTGVYTTPSAIMISVPQMPTNGLSGYVMFVAYEDYSGQVSAMTQITNIVNAQMSDLYAKTLVNAVTWYSGSGPPGSLVPPNSPAVYANTASGAAHGSLLYAWNGSTWSAFA